MAAPRVTPDITTINITITEPIGAIFTPLQRGPLAVALERWACVDLTPLKAVGTRRKGFDGQCEIHDAKDASAKDDASASCKYFATLRHD
jgi:hypothetical protein